ncbi:MAG: pimeloyl-ACP methyl ester carboxylesterase [Pseudohongiellaceae bacterium]|jgi:pimeloyl-ACP methyl ester carboxylesterase
MTEEAVLLGAMGSLVGIVTDPDPAVRAKVGPLPAFVFLNAGVTHRVGPSRLHVRLARRLAAAGFTSLRFDWSGTGDSGVRTDDLPIGESIILETREAMDHLASTRGIDKFVLIGICSGATISFLTAKEDDRVVGAVLINAQSHLHGMDADLGERLRSRTMTRHSWRIALGSSFRSKNWRKALGGQLDFKRIVGMMIGVPLRAIFGKGGGAETSAEPGARGASTAAESGGAFDSAAELRSVTQRGVRVFHLYSEGDEGLDYFNVVLGKRVKDVTVAETSQLSVMKGANHVFTLLWSQDQLVEDVCDWAQVFGTANP